MMDPEVWPLDPIAAAMLVVRAIDDIDSSGEEDQVALLSALLETAWGNAWAQNQ